MTSTYDVTLSTKALLSILKGRTFMYQGTELTCRTYYMKDDLVYVMCDIFTIKLHKDYASEVLTSIIEHNHKGMFGDEQELSNDYANGSNKESNG